MFSKVTEDPIVSLEDVQDGLIPDQRGLGIREIALAKKFAKRYFFPMICVYTMTVTSLWETAFSCYPHKTGFHCKLIIIVPTHVTWSVKYVFIHFSTEPRRG